jgi:hypothetical protein
MDVSRSTCELYGMLRQAGGAKPTSVFTLPFLSLPHRVSPSHAHIGVPAALRTPHSLTNPVGGADVADPILTLSPRPVTSRGLIPAHRRLMPVLVSPPPRCPLT